MGDAASEIDIAKPADEVWKVVGDFAGIASWSPGVDACEAEGELRTIHMFGMEIVEQLISRDDVARAITYSVVSGIPIVHHQATITVTPAGEGSHVTWAFEVQPDEMTGVMQQGYDGALDGLKRHLEG